MNPFHGVFVPLVTPMNSGKFDKTSMENLIISLEEIVDGYVPCLSTGEGESLTDQLWIDVVSTVRSRTEKPIVAGILRPTLEEISKLSKEAETLGCEAIAIPSQGNSSAAIIGRYKEIVRWKTLPIVAYNTEKEHLNTLEDIKTLESLGNIVAMKDSSKNTNFFREAVTLRSTHELNMALFQGWDNLLAESQGCDGYMIALANLEPDLCKRMFVQPSKELNKQILERFHTYNLDSATWYLEIKQELHKRKVIKSAEAVKN